MRVGLVGCVKSKRSRPAPARDLYVSPLFRGRRAYVEHSCDRWFILSAKHGLVEPTTVLEPYDETLTDASVATRRRWSAEVLGALDRTLGDISGMLFEVHAGATYLSFGLTEGVLSRGATVVNPTEGLSFGRQLTFYAAAPR